MAENEIAEREREQRAGCRRDAVIIGVILLAAFLFWLLTFPPLE